MKTKYGDNFRRFLISKRSGISKGYRASWLEVRRKKRRRLLTGSSIGIMIVDFKNTDRQTRREKASPAKAS